MIPKLSDAFLEILLITIQGATTAEGCKMNLPLKDALSPELYDMYPESVKWHMCGNDTSPVTYPKVKYEYQPYGWEIKIDGEKLTIVPATGRK